jgi:hypothetical protein
MFLSWFLFPLLLLGLSVGCGLLVDRASGGVLPSALVAPSGFTVIVLVGEIGSITPGLADLAAPATVALALAGFLLAPRSGNRGLERYGALAAVGVFAVYAAPIVFSGEPTFAGYIKLDDTATWLALTDRVAEAGRDLSGLAPSTYEATLHFNLGSGYPIGAFTPLATGSTILGRDPAWLFQPYLATMALLLTLCLYQLAGEVSRRPPLRAAIAFLAAQPALLFGYYLWGGVKEVATALLLALIAALIPSVVGPRLSWRGGIPIALAVAATLAVLTAAGASLWLLPMLALAALAIGVRAGGRALLSRLALVAGLALLVSLPWLLDAGLLPEGSGALTDSRELGNLTGPLSPWQAVGIWPSGDFRLHPTDSFATVVLLAVALFAAAIGLRQIWVRRALGPGAFVAGLAIGAFFLVAVGSPWVDGKALATCGPAILFAACVGAVWLWERGLRVEGGVVLGLIALGVLWSNFLGYREEYVAPYQRLAELERIGAHIAGQGPALMTEYEPYGARHFLRDADAEGASELRRRAVPLRSGKTLEKGETTDIDEFDLSGLLEYRTLVLRRSPLASRPPLPFQLLEAGNDYEVWQADSRPAPLDHLALEGAEGASAVPPCAEVERLAGLPGARHLAASVRTEPTWIPLGRLSLPASWEDESGGAYAMPASDGTATGSFEVAEGGSYGVWLGGSPRGDITVEVDGKEAGTSGPTLDHAGEYRQIGTVDLEPGSHAIAFSYESPGPLAPGVGGESFPLGPLVLSTGTAAEGRVEVLNVSEATSLCGRSLDWIEALPY